MTPNKKSKGEDIKTFNTPYIYSILNTFIGEVFPIYWRVLSHLLVRARQLAGEYSPTIHKKKDVPKETHPFIYLISKVRITIR